METDELIFKPQIRMGRNFYFVFTLLTADFQETESCIYNEEKHRKTDLLMALMFRKNISEFAAQPNRIT